MEEGIYYNEGWLESKVGGGGGNITDEGYMGRLLDEAMQMVERLHTLLDNVSERILARQGIPTSSEVELLAKVENSINDLELLSTELV